MKPLIFLDIDGVLNDHGFNRSAMSNSIKRSCVRELNRIIHETGAEIVLSSAWRYMVHEGAITLHGFAYMLRTHGLTHTAKIVGVTRRDGDAWEGNRRGKQIADYLDSNYPGSWPRYVVIDDLDLMISTEDHPFVHTESKVGLTRADADNAIVFLRDHP